MTPDWSALNDNSVVIVGATRRGKTGLLNLMSRATILSGYDGLTWIDPHGGVREIVDWLANPAHGQIKRPVHFLDPSSSMTFGLNPLEPYDDSWEACHDAANTLAAVVESRFEASPEETPRLARIIYIAGMVCARKHLTLLDLVELLSVGAYAVRSSLLEDFDNRIVKQELADLSLLAEKHPREFLAVVESCKNRFVRWLGDGGRLARILGQKSGLNARRVMDQRNIVLVDLSCLTYSDAAFLGTLITSMYFSAARRRPPLRCARHRLILDEAESLITVDVARMTDQCAKYGLNLVAAIQRLGQLRAKGEYIADALFTNCAIKICFGGLEPLSARYMTELLWTGYLDLQEWKDNSKRPVAVGQRKETVHSSSVSEMVAEHETYAHAVAESDAEAHGTMSTSGLASGNFSGTGDMSGVVMTPPTTLFGQDAPSSLSLGENSSRGSTEQSSYSSGESHVSIHSLSEGTTHGHGTSRGRSLSEGISEVFVIEYQWLESQMYGLEEQLHRHAGIFMNLPRRHCVIKIEDQRPFRTRTADLTPAFHSARFKTLALPLFLKATAARSPYLIRAEIADAAIAARVLAPKPAPEPLPVLTGDLIDRPMQFADDFWKQRKSPARPPSPSASKKPKSKKPSLTVIDGDKAK